MHKMHPRSAHSHSSVLEFYEYVRRQVDFNYCQSTTLCTMGNGWNTIEATVKKIDKNNFFFSSNFHSYLYEFFQTPFYLFLSVDVCNLFRYVVECYAIPCLIAREDIDIGCHPSSASCYMYLLSVYVHFPIQIRWFLLLKIVKQIRTMLADGKNRITYSLCSCYSTEFPYGHRIKIKWNVQISCIHKFTIFT